MKIKTHRDNNKPQRMVKDREDSQDYKLRCAKLDAAPLVSNI